MRHVSERDINAGNEIIVPFLAKGTYLLRVRVRYRMGLGGSYCILYFYTQLIVKPLTNYH